MEEGGLIPILRALKTETDPEARSRMLYCVSGEFLSARRSSGSALPSICLLGLLKKNSKAREEFTAHGGIAAISDILKHSSSDADLALRRKAAFLVKNLVIEDDSMLQKFKDEGTLNTLEDIVHSSNDQELVEKLLQLAIVALRRNPDSISAEQRARLKAELDNIRKRVTGEENGHFSLDPEDLEDLDELLNA